MGGILFLVRFPLASPFISVHYLLNQGMDFDQTCIGLVTLLGGGEELLDFGDLDLIFKVTVAL